MKHAHCTLFIALFFFIGCKNKATHAGPDIYPSTLKSHKLEGDIFVYVKKVELNIAKDLSFTARASFIDGSSKAIKGKQTSPLGNDIVAEYNYDGKVSKEKFKIEEKGKKVIITPTDNSWSATFRKE